MLAVPLKNRGPLMCVENMTWNKRNGGVPRVQACSYMNSAINIAAVNSAADDLITAVNRTYGVNLGTFLAQGS